MNIDPSRLRYLLAVARTGGVLAAADELHVTPSAVSQQITRLARETGHPLMTRTPGGSALTPEGLALAEAAQEIERTLAAVRSRLEHGDEELTGPLRIGGFQSFLSVVIAPSLPEWRQSLPGVRFHIMEAYPAALMKALRTGDLDAAVFELDTGEESAQLPKGMVEIPLLDDPWRLAIPAGTLFTDVSDLERARLPWLGEQPPAASSRAASRLRATLGFEQSAVHEFHTTETGLALVAAGEGMAVFPDLALRWITHESVEIVDVQGLGTRRIVLRGHPRSERAKRHLASISTLLRDAITARVLTEPVQ